MTKRTIGEELAVDEADNDGNAKRWRAIRALPGDLNGKLYVMCMRSISECSVEDISADPLVLLDLAEKDFYGLAERAGVQRRYKYQLYKRLKESGAISALTSGTQDFYRHFDAGHALLYVGISARLALREAAHKRKSRWMELAAHSTTEPFPSRAAVLKAERAAIEAEHPLFNVAHNDTPEARERLRAYLEGIGRMDLMGD